MIEKRNADIDILKGIGIVAMIAGHVPVNQILVHFIYIFHMPLFFWISGYLYKRKDFPISVIAKKYFRKLFIPYFFGGVCGYCLWLIEMKPISFQQGLAPVVSLFFFNTDGMPIAGALWYLTAIFFVYIIYIVVDKVRVFLKNVIIISLAIIGFYLKGLMDVRLPFALDVAFVGLLFYHIGHLCKIFESQMVFAVNRYTGIFFFISATIGGMINEKVSMRTCDYGNKALFIMSAVLLVVCLYRFILWINEKWSIPFRSYFIFVGKGSMVYLCANEIVINVINSVSRKFINDAVVLCCVKFIGCLVVIGLIRIVIKKIDKLNFLMGE